MTRKRRSTAIRSRVHCLCRPAASRKARRCQTGGGGKTTPCIMCHGVTLLGLGDWPALAGRHPNYIVRQLWNFQNGDRQGRLWKS